MNGMIRLPRFFFGGFIQLLMLVLAGMPHPVGAAGNNTLLLRFPDIHKDRIVFAYGGDLWQAAITEGFATRLTSHAGVEYYPRFSPDGRWIAFSGEYGGNLDVYIIPAMGGKPKRLTYHGAADKVLDWSPDGTSVLFRSARHHPNGKDQLFLVSREGGMPSALPLPRSGPASFAPDGRRIVYNPVSRENRTWKRYRGGQSMFMGIFDLEKMRYTPLPISGANDMFPMWHERGIYFTSDLDGVVNLYRFDQALKKAIKLTDHQDYDIKSPNMGPDAIVYEQGGRLHRFDLKTEQTQILTITAAGDAQLTLAKKTKVNDQIHHYAISPHAQRALFEARGDIFTLPAKHGVARNLTQTPGIYERNPAWSPDGKQIAYLSDASGEYELYVIPAQGGETRALTHDGAEYRYGPRWSPDNSRLLYWDKSLHLYYFDINAGKSILIDQADFAAGSADGAFGDTVWSPDGRYIAYSKSEENLQRSLYIYALESADIHRISDGVYSSYGPTFDPKGRYLYFLSDRSFYPASGTIDSNRYSYHLATGVYALTLSADEASPMALRNDEESEPKETTKETESDDEKSADDAESKALELIDIELEGMGQRIAMLSVPPGVIAHLSADDKHVYYLRKEFRSLQSKPGSIFHLKPGSNATLQRFALEEREEQTILSAIDDYRLAHSDQKLLYRAGDRYGIIEAAPDKARVGDGLVAVEHMSLRLDPPREWRQLFVEAWRIERDFFWNAGMSGIDWNAIRKRYEPLLADVSDRSDLNYLIGEMIAELRTSHAYVSGGKRADVERSLPGLLGADVSFERGRVRIARIYRNQPWLFDAYAPLDQPGLDVSEGDYILAIEGVELDSRDNLFQLLDGRAGQVVDLTIHDKPEMTGSRRIQVRAINDESALRYLAWVERNQALVDTATDGRIGYMHVPDTSTMGMIMFDQQLAAQRHKEGLIVDERFNRGGAIPSFYTEKLARSTFAYVAPREGKNVAFPLLGVNGPKVMLINESAGSGGDLFPWLFKQQDIGPLVGSRTWGGLVGFNIPRVPLIDGGIVTAPEFGLWAPEPQPNWIAEGYGVDPDYPVPQRPDLLAKGEDIQLNKAIELVLKLHHSRHKELQPPPYPGVTQP